MPNRYARDELIRIALDMAQVPNLKVLDMPNNVVRENALSVQWLQDIIDFWYHMVPFSSSIALTQLNIPGNTDIITLPADFILDVRNGYIIQTTENIFSKQRMQRVPLQKWINRDLAYQGRVQPYSLFYTIQGKNVKVTPMSETSKNAWLWYYALSPVLSSDSVPLFPSDYVLTEYIRIRALEWCGQFDPGTAQAFCDKIVKSMKAAGLMNEPEDDEIPFDTSVHTGYNNGGSYGWMGPR